MKYERFPATIENLMTRLGMTCAEAEDVLREHREGMAQIEAGNYMTLDELKAALGRASDEAVS